MENGVNLLKQPAPSVNGTTLKTDSARKYNMPKVGVIDAPNLSKTPIRDMVQLKKAENPYTIYKLKPKQNKYFNFYGLTSIGVALCGILTAIKMFKK